MNPDKKIIIDELLERVNASPFVLVVEYTGMTVPQFSELRTRLAASGRRVPRRQEHLHEEGPQRGRVFPT